MSNFTQRLITGAFFVTAIIGFVLLGQFTYVLLMLIINLLALEEFYRLFTAYAPRKWAGLFLSAVLLITSILVITRWSGAQILLLNIPVVFAIFLTELFVKHAKPFECLAFTLMGITYVTIPVIFLMGIPFFLHGMYYPNFILGFFLIVWAHDSGAYALGTVFGKHPLFARISPNKTWEGSIGGAICAAWMAYLNPIFFTELDKPGWFVIAGIVIVAGTFGDLVKSMMKRSLGVKDSGSILPGHGGMLDRFDAMLASAPFVFIYLLFNIRL